MDPLTHGVASLALQRAFFPRAKILSVLAILIAGVLPDLDWFSALFGPVRYLSWNRAVTHSLLDVAGLAALAVLLLFVSAAAFGRKFWNGFVNPADNGRLPLPNLQLQGEDTQSYLRRQTAAVILFTFIAALCSALLHLALDLCQADGLALLWPFSTRRFALDVLPYLEPWLMAILVAAILLPELFRLVGEEIGSRSKRPPGRNGAIAGFAFAALYLGLRFMLHGNAVASLEAHTIAGESPRRAAAFADSASPFLWHSIVETESTLSELAVHSAGGAVTDASGVTTWRKPEPSPMLTAAQGSPAATAFVKFARFPKATVEKEIEGYSVEIRDLKNVALEEKSRVIFADINLDISAKVVSSELHWQKSAVGTK